MIEEATPEELEACPFCEGREKRTPPETLALPHREPPDSPGWTVRVVPNLYPAFERQEVVVHDARHIRSFAELDETAIGLVAVAWQQRARAACEAGTAYVHALVNEGKQAGASLAHSHSQLIWMRLEPPIVTIERSDPCGVCQLVAGGDGVVEFDTVRVVSPRAARVPYELLIAPRAHESDAFESDVLRDGLAALCEAVGRLRGVEGPIPWNAWLHTGTHWHIELVPRLTVLAGIELGAGIYVNTLPPQEAAARLRAVAPPTS